MINNVIVRRDFVLILTKFTENACFHPETTTWWFEPELSAGISSSNINMFYEVRTLEFRAG